EALGRGYRVLVLTNAMRPMLKLKAPLLDLKARYGDRLALRVSIDHYSRELHELERGKHAWGRMMEGFRWLVRNGFNVAVAGRTFWKESADSLRAGYARLFAAEGAPIDARDEARLVLFPEMDMSADVP